MTGAPLTLVSRRHVDPPVMLGQSEAQFQQQVLDVARLRGWTLVYHPADNVPRETKSGKRYLQDVKPGFPDLVLVRERIVYAELKTMTGRLSKAQQKWRDGILAAGGDWHLWRPSDIVDIANVHLR